MDDCLVIAKFDEKWLFTQHKIRGIEFAGGKGEGNETNIDTAKRELMEETGAYADEFIFIADYVIKTTERCFTKRVFFCEIIKLISQKNYFETRGPVLLKGKLRTLVKDASFSFFMQDEGMQAILAELYRKVNVEEM